MPRLQRRQPSARRRHRRQRPGGRGHRPFALGCCSYCGHNFCCDCDHDENDPFDRACHIRDPALCCDRGHEEICPGPFLPRHRDDEWVSLAEAAHGHDHLRDPCRAPCYRYGPVCAQVVHDQILNEKQQAGQLLEQPCREKHRHKCSACQTSTSICWRAHTPTWSANDDPTSATPQDYPPAEFINYFVIVSLLLGHILQSQRESSRSGAGIS